MIVSITLVSNVLDVVVGVGVGAAAPLIGTSPTAPLVGMLPARAVTNISPVRAIANTKRFIWSLCDTTQKQASKHG